MISEANYKIAERAWSEYDYETTNIYLQKILSVTIPEPDLLPILGLTLLPLLWRRWQQILLR